jgi:hypothetical protein
MLAIDAMTARLETLTEAVEALKGLIETIRRQTHPIGNGRPCDAQCPHRRRRAAAGGAVLATPGFHALDSNQKSLLLAACEGTAYSHAMWRASASTRRPPGYIEPCIPTRISKPPAGPQWVHEIKHDGYRLIARKQDGRVRLFTRRGYDWTGRYSPAAASHMARCGLESGASANCRRPLYGLGSAYGDLRVQPQQSADFRRRSRLAEQIALKFSAACRPHQLQLLPRLDPLGGR